MKFKICLNGGRHIRTCSATLYYCDITFTKRKNPHKPCGKSKEFSVLQFNTNTCHTENSHRKNGGKHTYFITILTALVLAL